MSPAVDADRESTGTAAKGGLAVTLDTPLPRLPAGRPTAIFCCGTCFHPTAEIRRLEIVVDGVAHEPTAFGMPRVDRFRELNDLRGYRSGFWATLPVPGREQPGAIPVRLRAELDNGHVAEAPLAEIEVVERHRPLAHGATGSIAVCMATYDPDPDLLRTQIASLREQTDKGWICLISDDCSRPERFADIEREVGDDERFVLSRSPERLGFYRNFERALEMVPAEAELVALCDQDDRWYPDKLETLRRAIGTAELAYSDQRLVDADGRVLSETLWKGRRNNYSNFASLVIANAIAGAASLMRREVVEAALPFPEGPGWQFHDHWLAMVAMARGELTYVDRPLYDYVHHAAGVVGKVSVEERSPEGRRRRLLEGLRAMLRGWRAAYFRAYVQLELQARVLEIRCADTLTARKRRALRMLIGAGRSPIWLAWLALRPLRALAGRNETLGAEALLARGVLWKQALGLRARGRRRPRADGGGLDAAIPPFDVDSFGQRRLKRWLARS